jgi:hypothetical protein
MPLATAIEVGSSASAQRSKSSGHVARPIKAKQGAEPGSLGSKSAVSEYFSERKRREEENKRSSVNGFLSRRSVSVLHYIEVYILVYSSEPSAFHHEKEKNRRRKEGRKEGN